MTENKENDQYCSFCGKHKDDVQVLIEKPGMFICNECVGQFNQLLTQPGKWEPTELYRDCSFCSFMQNVPEVWMFGAPSNKGTKLIRGPKFSICDDCLEVCNEIVVGME